MGWRAGLSTLLMAFCAAVAHAQSTLRIVEPATQAGSPAPREMKAYPPIHAANRTDSPIKPSAAVPEFSEVHIKDRPGRIKSPVVTLCVPTNESPVSGRLEAAGSIPLELPTLVATRFAAVTSDLPPRAAGTDPKASSLPSAEQREISADPAASRTVRAVKPNVVPLRLAGAEEELYAPTSPAGSPILESLGSDPNMYLPVGALPGPGGGPPCGPNGCPYGACQSGAPVCLRS